MQFWTRGRQGEPQRTPRTPRAEFKMQSSKCKMKTPHPARLTARRPLSRRGEGTASRMQDAGCTGAFLDTGRRTGKTPRRPRKDAGCRIPDTGYRMRAHRCIRGHVDTGRRTGKAPRRPRKESPYPASLPLGSTLSLGGERVIAHVCVFLTWTCGQMEEGARDVRFPQKLKALLAEFGRARILAAIHEVRRFTGRRWRREADSGCRPWWTKRT